MNFFIILEDSEENAEILPDYAIFKVNCREGIQILSDIGHLFNITWEGQYKQYSPYHAKTREFWRSREDFINFVQHLACCLDEYTKRAKKQNKKNYTVWHEIFDNFIYEAYNQLCEKIPEGWTTYQQDLFCLLHQKRDKLTEEDIKFLELIMDEYKI